METDNFRRLYKLMSRIAIAIALIFVVTGAYAIHDSFFGGNKIVEKLEQHSLQLSVVIENNRKLESRLNETQVGISKVHKSLLESQIKLTKLIEDTKGSTANLKNSAKEVEKDLAGVINEIDSVLNINVNDTIR